ncbi:MAG: diguanylate cyclase [Anaerolineales bacterium]
MGKITTEGYDLETIRKRLEALSELIDAAPGEATEVLPEVEVELSALLMDLKESRKASRPEIHEELYPNSDRSEEVPALMQAFAEAGLDFQDVLNTITKRIADSFGDICLILLFSAENDHLRLVSINHAEKTVPKQIMELLSSIQINAQAALVEKVSNSSRTLRIGESASKEIRPLLPEAEQGNLERFPVHSALLAPLRAQGRLLGIMGVLRFIPNALHTVEDQRLIDNIASRAALAIENARLYAAEAQRVRALDGLHVATAALLSTLDLDELLSIILDAAQSAIPAAEKGMLHLVAPDSGKLQTSALLGYAESSDRKDTGEQITVYIAQAVRERKPLLISNTEIPSPFPGDGDDPEAPTIRSTIITPLILGEAVLGVLSLNASRLGAFTEADLRVLESFAATTSAAIQNARLHAKVQKMAITDPLTGIYNRRGFFELGRREIERLKRFGHPLSAIMLDVDHFKLINDTHGHATGDRVLITLAERLINNIRGVDILGRYGGDEFCILLPETDLLTADTIAGRLRKSIARHPISTDDGLLPVTISLGVATATEETIDLDSLLNLADDAMYTAKQSGRDRIEVRSG